MMKTAPGTLLIRADANASMGAGHAMRCLALAQAWQNTGGQVVFAMVDPAAAIAERLVGEQCRVHSINCAAPNSGETVGLSDVNETLALAHDLAAAWVVVDGYGFDASYQRHLKDAGLKVLWIDDFGHGAPYSADVVLNQNLDAEASLYQNRRNNTRLLIGSPYALLRREFTEWRHWDRTFTGRPRCLLVALGGGDPDNLTGRILEALTQAGPSKPGTEIDSDDDANGEGTAQIKVIVGGANPHWTGLKQMSRDLGPSVKLEHHVTDIPGVMAWADQAITASGSICWELAFMGLPAILLPIADNQIPLAEAMGRRGLGIASLPGEVGTELGVRTLRDWQGMSTSELTEMSTQGQALIDGYGAERVVDVLLRGQCVLLRDLQAGDERLLFEWANEPRTRAMAYHSELIDWDDHRQWFASRSSSTSCSIYIAHDSDGVPVGQVRFDINAGGDAVIDISVSSRCRGCGFGHRVLTQGVTRLRRLKGTERFHAWVKPENLASCRSFEKAGFRRVVADSTPDGHHYLFTASIVAPG